MKCSVALALLVVSSLWLAGCAVFGYRDTAATPAAALLTPIPIATLPPTVPSSTLLSATPTSVPSATVLPVTPVSTVAAGRRATRFGVITGVAVASQPEVINIYKDLGAGWVRINFHLDGKDTDYRPLLEAGINLVITFNNADPTNIDTTYGAPKEWPNAGFPFKAKAVYQQRIRNALAPALPYLSKGRQVWVQADNEITDASINPKAAYWRSTTAQYLNELQAFQEVVRSINPSIPIVTSSFASETLDAALDPKNPRHKIATAFVTKLLAEGQSDVVDLHFYGCVEEIAAKAQWVESHAGRQALDLHREWRTRPALPRHAAVLGARPRQVRAAPSPAASGASLRVRCQRRQHLPVVFAF